MSRTQPEPCMPDPHTVALLATSLAWSRANEDRDRYSWAAQLVLATLACQRCGTVHDVPCSLWFDMCREQYGFTHEQMVYIAANINPWGGPHWWQITITRDDMLHAIPRLPAWY